MKHLYPCVLLFYAVILMGRQGSANAAEADTVVADAKDQSAKKEQTSRDTVQSASSPGDFSERRRQLALANRRDPFRYDLPKPASAPAPKKAVAPKPDPAQYKEATRDRVPRGIKAVGFITMQKGTRMAVLSIPGYERKFFVREGDVIRLEPRKTDGHQADTYLHVRRIEHDSVRVAPSDRADQEVIIQ